MKNKVIHDKSVLTYSRIIIVSNICKREEEE